MASFEDVMPSAADVKAAFGDRGVGDTDRVVAVLVSGRAVERSTWSDEVEVSETDFDRLLDEDAPTPDVNDFNGAKFRALDPRSRGAKVRRCTECLYRPENGRCLRCNGTGKLQVGSDDWVNCSGCIEGIALPCSVCNGTRRAVLVKIAFGEDVVRRFAHIFLPELPFPLREPLTLFFKNRTSVPDVLSIDLRDDFAAADAYRGRRSRAEVKGHRADAALALARNYVDRIHRLPKMAAVEVAAFAWPMVVGAFAGDADPSAVVVRDELGSVCRFG